MVVIIFCNVLLPLINIQTNIRWKQKAFITLSSKKIVKISSMGNLVLLIVIESKNFRLRNKDGTEGH